MHILELPSFFPPYGGLFCLDQSKALASLGHEVRIVANVQISIRKSLKDFLFKPIGDNTIVMDSIKVECHEMRGIPLCVHINVRRWLNNVLRMYNGYAKRYGQPDIIHAHCAKWAGYAAYLINKKFGVPYVVTEHLSSMILNKEFGEPPSKVWQIPLLKTAYRSAGMVIPVSRELVDDISPYFGIDYKFTPISNTIDTDFFSYRKRKSMDGRKYSFCCLAIYEYRKGYDVLFKAFDMLAQSNENVELWIAGSGTDSKECLSLIKDLKSKDRIKAIGFLDKRGVLDLLYHSDCLVLPSRSEAQGLVLLEAMSTGIETIATECIPRCVRIEGGCHIVPIDDAEAMSKMMFKVMNDGFSDGEAISNKVKNMASPVVVGRKLEKILSEIIGISAN